MIDKNSEFETQAALHEVCTSSDPLDALNAYQKHQDILKDWRIIYAANENTGPFKLRRNEFSKNGLISTSFRGKSLWVLDTESAQEMAPIAYKMGFGIFVDSNAATFIQNLAYRDNPSLKLNNYRSFLKETFSNTDLANLNPYFYLLEAQRSWTPKTIENCHQTIAAIHALSLDSNPLDELWGRRFRTIYKDQAEAYASDFIADFKAQLSNGIFNTLFQYVDIVESMLIRTIIIEVSSSKSVEYKMNELIQFMNKELSTFMIREFIVCADILCRSGLSSLSKKLNSVLDKADPLTTIKNCAWDLFLPRAMDFMANPTLLPDVDFYIANLLTFDKDVADILKLTELRALAIHRKSAKTFPFHNEELKDWMTVRVGEKRMASLNSIFNGNAFEHRALKRSHDTIKNILVKDRARLIDMKNAQH